jgi:hypothetical protein
MPPAPPQGIPVAGGDPDGDGDDDDAGGSWSHSTELSEEPEPEKWIARPITCDVFHGCCNTPDVYILLDNEYGFKHKISVDEMDAKF